MNTKLTVRVNTDANFIPVMYRIIAMTIGSTDATTYCLLETVRLGWNTEANYNKWKSTVTYDPVSGTTTLIGRQKTAAGTGQQGTVGELTIDTLNDLRTYNYPESTPSRDI